MNSKKVNWLFLSMILTELLVLLVLMIIGPSFSIGIVSNLLISEMILVVPTLLFLFFSKGERKELFLFRKLKVSTVLMIVIFTYLLMPLVTVVNAISMLFADNVVQQISGEVLELPFLLAFFMLAIFGPFCEEMVFRGVVQGGYRKTGTPFQAILFSAILFGLIHMNFNQAPYAILIGIALAVLKEVTGSIWAPFICHMVFNGNTAILLYMSEKIMPKLMESIPEAAMSDVTMGVVGNQELMMAICVYAVIAVVTTAIGLCALVWIAKNEGGQSRLQSLIKPNKENKGKIVTVTWIVGVMLCLIFMILL